MADFDSLTSDVAALAASVAALQSTVDSLTTAVGIIDSELMTQMGVVEGQISTLNQDIDIRLNDLTQTLETYGDNAVNAINSSINSAVSGISIPQYPNDYLSSSDSRLNYLDAPVSAIPTNPVLNSDGRLDYLDTQVSNVVSAVNGIYFPNDYLNTNDTRLNNLDAPISAIPTTPLLTDDARLNVLDTQISQVAGQVISYLPDITPLLRSDDTRLNNLDAPISGIAVPTDLLRGSDTVSGNSGQSVLVVLGWLMDQIQQDPNSWVFNTLQGILNSTNNIPVSGILSSTDPRLDNLNAPVGNIPTNPLLMDDSRLSSLDNLDARVSLIPTNPFLDNSFAISYLDAPISGIPTTVAQSIAELQNYLGNPFQNNDSRLNYLDAPISAIPLTPVLVGDIVGSNGLTIEAALSAMYDAIDNNLDARVSAIPTTTLLSDDVRLDNLNAPIGSIPTNTLSADTMLPSNGVTVLSGLDFTLANVESLSLALSQINPGYSNGYTGLVSLVAGGACEILLGPIPLSQNAGVFNGGYLGGQYQTPTLTILNGNTTLYLDVSTKAEDSTGVILSDVGISGSSGVLKLSFSSFPAAEEGLYKLILKDNGVFLPYYQDVLVLNAEHYNNISLEMANLLATKAIGTPDLSGIANSITGLGSPLQSSDSRLDNLDAPVSGISAALDITGLTATVNNVYSAIGGTVQAIDSRLDYLNAPIGSIPTNPLLASDYVLPPSVSGLATSDDVLGINGNIATLQSSVNAIPIDTLLSTDPHLNYLDAPISGVGNTSVDLTGVMMSADSRLDNLDAPISAIPTTPMLAVDYVAPDNTSVGSILARVNQFLDFSVGAIYAKVSALDFATAIGEYFGRPVNTKTLNIEVFLADDYYGTEGRAVEWKSTSWPDLTGRTVTFTCNNVSITGTIAVSGVDQVIAFNLSNANIATFGAGTHSFQVTVVLQNGHHITLLTGKLTAI